MNDWRTIGACRDQPTWLFFPIGTEGGGIGKQQQQQQQQAMAVCADCPVLLDCRQWAIAHEQHGVWGGTSEKERIRIRRRLGIRLNEPSGDDDSWKRPRTAYLWRQGWRLDQIADELHTNQRQINRWLNAEGIDAYPPGGRAPRRRHEDRVRKRTA